MHLVTLPRLTRFEVYFGIRCLGSLNSGASGFVIREEVVCQLLSRSAAYWLVIMLHFACIPGCIIGSLHSLHLAHIPSLHVSNQHPIPVMLKYSRESSSRKCRA